MATLNPFTQRMLRQVLFSAPFNATRADPSAFPVGSKGLPQ